MTPPYQIVETRFGRMDDDVRPELRPATAAAAEIKHTNFSYVISHHNSIPSQLLNLGVVDIQQKADNFTHSTPLFNSTMERLLVRVTGDNGGADQTLKMPTFNQLSMIKTTVLSVLFVISLIGNFVTLVQMLRMRRRKSTINTLILHLATADLLVTFFCIMTDAIWSSTVQWYAGNAVCKLVKFLQVFGLYLSTYILVIISIDRCYAILDPMSRNKAPKRVRMMVIAAWILSALFSMPQAFIFRVARGPFKAEFYQCVTMGFYTEPWQEQVYSLVSMLLMFIIPLIAMLVSYSLIFITIARKSRELQAEKENVASKMLRGPVRTELFRKAKVKSLKMTAVIVAAFIACWTPYYVLFIRFTYYDIPKVDQRRFMWIFFFGMSNSMINPLIYGAFHVCRRRKRRQSLPAQRENDKPQLKTSSSRPIKKLGDQTSATVLPEATQSPACTKQQYLVTYHFSV